MLPVKQIFVFWFRFTWVLVFVCGRFTFCNLYLMVINKFTNHFVKILVKCYNNIFVWFFKNLKSQLAQWCDIFVLTRNDESFVKRRCDYLLMFNLFVIIEASIQLLKVNSDFFKIVKFMKDWVITGQVEDCILTKNRVFVLTYVIIELKKLYLHIFVKFPVL